MNTGNQSGFTDKDIASDLLTNIKDLASGYHTATVEASTNEIRNTFYNNQNECLAGQKQLFDCMYQKGWYQVQK